MKFNPEWFSMISSKHRIISHVSFRNPFPCIHSLSFWCMQWAKQNRFILKYYVSLCWSCSKAISWLNDAIRLFVSLPAHCEWTHNGPQNCNSGEGFLSLRWINSIERNRSFCTRDLNWSSHWMLMLNVWSSRVYTFAYASCGINMISINVFMIVWVSFVSFV